MPILRLDSESTDYVLKEYTLDPIICQAVRKYAPEFIMRKLTLDYKPVDVSVVTDEFADMRTRLRYSVFKACRAGTYANGSRYSVLYRHRMSPSYVMTIRLFRDNAEGGYEKKRYKKERKLTDAHGVFHASRGLRHPYAFRIPHDRADAQRIRAYQSRSVPHHHDYQFYRIRAFLHCGIQVTANSYYSIVSV